MKCFIWILQKKSSAMPLFAISKIQISLWNSCVYIIPPPSSQQILNLPSRSSYPVNQNGFYGHLLKDFFGISFSSTSSAQT